MIRSLSAICNYGAMAVLVFVSGCEAQTPSRYYETGAGVLTGREIHELQNSTKLDVAQIVKVGNDQYAIPRAPYVRLAEVGRGTSSAHFQAWLELKGADTAPNAGIRSKVVTASVGFSAPGHSSVPEPDAGWTRSTVGIQDLPAAEIWIDTRECVDDQAPAPSSDKYMINLRAIWKVNDAPFQLSCNINTAVTPNGRQIVSCFGGSGQASSGIKYGFYGSDSLDQGCRAALERLVTSFAYLPLIVADWRNNK